MRRLRHLHEVPPESLGEAAAIRVLVADDDRRMRMLVRSMLAGTGITVLEAADGDHALLRVEHETPDAAILDWRMPGGGLPLARALVQDYGMVGRVIMLSSLADPRDRLEARRAGVARYMVKPPERSMLLSAVAAAIGARVL
jgi:CheY-like chemotaxis protein